MKAGSYAKYKAKFLSKFNLNELILSESHYKQLIDEACLRSTVLERRIKIREELTAIRMLRNAYK